jgi:Arc/MetJ family transcription regulator
MLCADSMTVMWASNFLLARRCGSPQPVPWRDTHICEKLVYSAYMSRTNIDINDELIRKARKLTHLKTKRQIVEKALELLVRSEDRKGILRYYGTGIWGGNLKRSRRNRV